MPSPGNSPARAEGPEALSFTSVSPPASCWRGKNRTKQLTPSPAACLGGLNPQQQQQNIPSPNVLPRARSQAMRPTGTPQGIPQSWGKAGYCTTSPKTARSAILSLPVFIAQEGPVQFFIFPKEQSSGGKIVLWLKHWIADLRELRLVPCFTTSSLCVTLGKSLIPILQMGN